MSIEVNILGKYEMAYGTEVEVSYRKILAMPPSSLATMN